jgi:hypothetical protein
MLYIEVDYMDLDALKSVVNLAEKGLPICLKKKPLQAGFKKSGDFNILLEKLVKLPNVSDQLNRSIGSSPLVKGENLPEFWCRTDGKSAKIFFANPLSKKMTYPMKYGMAFQESAIERQVVVNFIGKSTPVLLKFEPYQSVLLDIDGSGNLKFEDITFVPKTPEKEIGK